jgi:hypothetical protein
MLIIVSWLAAGISFSTPGPFWNTILLLAVFPLFIAGSILLLPKKK